MMRMKCGSDGSRGFDWSEVGYHLGRILEVSFQGSTRGRWVRERASLIRWVALSESRWGRGDVLQLRAIVIILMCCRYYSMYGHIEALAKEIQKGANSVAGVEATLYQVSPIGRVLVKPELILKGVCHC